MKMDIDKTRLPSQFTMRDKEQLHEVAARAFPDYLSIVRYGSSVRGQSLTPRDIDVLVMVPTVPANNRYAINLDGRWIMVYSTTFEELDHDLTSQYYGLAIAGKLFFPVETIAGSDMSEAQFAARSRILQLSCHRFASQYHWSGKAEFRPSTLLLMAGAFLCEIAPQASKIWSRALVAPDLVESVVGSSEELERLVDYLLAAKTIRQRGLALSVSEEVVRLQQASPNPDELQMRRMAALAAAEKACRGWRPISRWAETLNQKYDEVPDYSATVRRIVRLIEEQCNASTLLR